MERPSGSQTLVSLLRPKLSSATAAKAHARTATTKTSFFIQYLISSGVYYSISTEHPRQIRRAAKFMVLSQRDEPLGQRPIPALAAKPSLLMSARRGVGASRAAGRRAAPDALVAARAVPVQPVRTIRASVSITRRAAPFAVLLVVAMFMKPVWAVCASVPVAR